MRKKKLARPACHRPREKKLPGIPAAARSSTQAGQLLFFAKNLAGKKFGTDLGSLGAGSVILERPSAKVGPNASTYVLVPANSAAATGTRIWGRVGKNQLGCLNND